MGEKDEVERAIEYGEEDYYDAIREQPSYQTWLNRVRTDYNEKSWIQSPFALPRLPQEDFEAARAKYVAKYGSKIQIPGFEDIFHLSLPVNISAEEIAAHKWAQAHKMPSPLSDEQLKTLSVKKYRYLRMLSSPEPYLQRNATAILTAMDNAEDAIVTLAVLGRLALKFVPKVRERAIPVLGWMLLGSDILNLGNMMVNIQKAGMARKRKLEGFTDSNPFTSKAKASRLSKANRTLPTFGEILEIAQTTDQLFGVGLCLGGIMGFFQDAIDKGFDQVTQAGVNAAVTLQYPSAYRTIWADAIESAQLLWTGAPDFFPYEAKQVLITANAAATELYTAFRDDDPLMSTTNLNKWMKQVSKTHDPISRLVMEDLGVDPANPISWPIIQKPLATLEEITYTYASRIKDNFQKMGVAENNDYDTWLLAHQADEFVKTQIASISDDGTVQVSNTAEAAAAKDMARANLIIPPSTDPEAMLRLYNSINDYERSFGGSPNTKELEQFGTQAEVDWIRKQPEDKWPDPQEIFPDWNAIQDQLGQIFDETSE